MAEHVYKFEHKPHGLALIIVNETFEHQSFRCGAEKDLENMQTLFKAFDFTVEVYKDLSANDMLTELARAALNEPHAESDCFVCVISTHGEEVKHTHLGQTTTQHVLYGTDDKFNYTSDFTKLFDNCPGLAGKPKLFFIQSLSPWDITLHSWTKACRSSEGHTKEDLGHQVLVLHESKSATDQSRVTEGIAAIHLDAFPRQEFTETCKDQDKDVSEGACQESQMPEEEIFCQETAEDVIGKDDTAHAWLPPSSIACFKDELIMWPVVSGLRAPRYASTGSWMLTFLFEELMKMQPNEPLLRALTRVSYRMANEKSDPEINVVSCINHRLCKEIYFTLDQKSLILAIMES